MSVLAIAGSENLERILLRTAQSLLCRDAAPALADPLSLMRHAGMEPDSWQRELLTCDAKQMLLLCCRQSGKSTVAAALALRAALFEAPALVLLVSPSLRQSGELFRKVLSLYRHLPDAPHRIMESALRIELANGSRIISLPGAEDTIRGYSNVRCLIIDEAARVDDDLYKGGVRPMLAVSQGRLICLSTPFGKRGWFYDEHTGSGGDWHRVTITADQCPRIPPVFLDSERRSLGERWFNQEYMCSFEDVAGSVFRAEDIDAAFSDGDDPDFTDWK